MKHISEEKLAKYFDVSVRALAKAKPAQGHEKEAEIILDMANRYHSDAKHFKDKNEICNAFAALNYLHGWLDCGARLGLLDVDNDDTLFTVDSKE